MVNLGRIRLFQAVSIFDAVAWMRKRRAEIDEEDNGLSWEEKARKTRHLLRNDPLWKRLKSRVMRTEAPVPGARKA